jgi:hypothetical protein
VLSPLTANSPICFAVIGLGWGLEKVGFATTKAEGLPYVFEAEPCEN